MSPLARNARRCSFIGAFLALAAGALGGPALGDDGPLAESFAIAPRVVELSGKPGERIPFEVEVSTRHTPHEIEVAAVEFAQAEDGEIAPRVPSATAAVEVSIEGATRISLGANGTQTIRGSVLVRGGRGPALRLYGLRFTGEERKLAVGRGPAKDVRGGIDIRVAYVARLEVRCEGRAAPHAGDLRLLDGAVVDLDGRPVVRVRIENPTDGALEVEGECQVFQAEPRKRIGPSFPLILPVNALRAGAARLHGRVLSGARVRLEEVLPFALPPGAYVVCATVRAAAGPGQAEAAGHERVRREWPVEVRPGSFPAQDFVLGRSVGPVFVSPSQIELGAGHGAARLVSLLLENTSTTAVEVSLAAEDGASGPADWLVVRPDHVSLEPRSRRRVGVSVRAVKDAAGDARYASLRVDVAGAGDARGLDTRRLPVALLPADRVQPSIEADPIERLADAGEGLAFAVTLRNRGRTHATVDAMLALEDGRGLALGLGRAGHGQWLLPGESMRLLFHVARPQRTGAKKVTVTLGRGPGLPRLEADLEPK